MKGSFDNILKSKIPLIVYWYENNIWGFDDERDETIDEQLEVFDKLKETLKDKIRIIKINLNSDSDINKKLADSCKIRKFPFIQIYNNGKEVYNYKGHKEFSVLMDMILDCYSTDEKFIDEQ